MLISYLKFLSNKTSMEVTSFHIYCNSTLFSSKQRDLYEESFRDLVQAVLDGFNGTIFAYGQTGTGKTFTMQGELEEIHISPRISSLDYACKPA